MNVRIPRGEATLLGIFLSTRKHVAPGGPPGLWLRMTTPPASQSGVFLLRSADFVAKSL